MLPGWLPDQGHLHMSSGNMSHGHKHRPRRGPQVAVLAGTSPWPQVAGLAARNRLFLSTLQSLVLALLMLCFFSSPICLPWDLYTAVAPTVGRPRGWWTSGVLFSTASGPLCIQHTHPFGYKLFSECSPSSALPGSGWASVYLLSAQAAEQ